MKYDDVAYFASQLPRLRRQVARDIDAGDMSLDTVAAPVVRLMVCTTFGSVPMNTPANESDGLTTLKSMHVKHIKGEEAEGRLTWCSPSPGNRARIGTSPSRTTTWWI